MKIRNLDIKFPIKLGFILFLLSILLFSFISDTGMTGDDAVYSTRAIGRLDFMFAEQQPTPLQWFENLPWWTNLSYHDALPVVLYTQHIFLSFHESIFFAKLPSVLFAIGTVIIIFFWCRKLWGEEVAFYSALFLTVNPFFLWAGRVSFLEMGVIFFCSLSFYFFSLFLEKQKYWLPFAIAFGLALLTKYTAMFIIPAVFYYLVSERRDIFRKKEFYYALIIILILVSPIAIYNIMMYKTTGHFDLQFSRLLGQKSPWHLAGATGNYGANFISIFLTLGIALSYPYFIFMMGGLIIALKEIKKYFILIITLVFLTLQFVFGDPGQNYLSLYTPFGAVLVAIILNYFHDRFKKNKIRKFIVVSFFIYCLLLSLNTIFSISGSSIIGWTRSSATNSNSSGVYQLDDYLSHMISNERITSRFDVYRLLKPKSSALRKFMLDDEQFNKPLEQVIVYDQNINWFSRLWLFERRRFYYNLPFFSSDEFLTFAPEIIKGIKVIYFIKATNFGALDGEKYWTKTSDVIEKGFFEKQIKPKEIFGITGDVVYKVYRGELAPQNDN